MEDEHRYIPTPTRDLRIETDYQITRHYPRRSDVGGLRDPSISVGRKNFYNSRTFCTLSTKLCSNSGQPLDDVCGLGSDRTCSGDSLKGVRDCVDNTSSHSDIDSAESGSSDIEVSDCDNKDKPAHGRPSLVNSGRSNLSSIFGPSATCSRPDNYNKVRCSENSIMGSLQQSSPMGSLQKSSGIAFDKTDSFGFCSSDGRYLNEDASNRGSTDVPQIGARKRKNALAMTHWNSSDVPNVGLPALEPGFHGSDTGRIGLSNGHVDNVFFNNDITSYQHGEGTHLAPDQAVFHKSVTTDNPHIPSAAMLSDQSVFQNSSACLSPTKSGPPLRHQLSKRRSEIFGAVLEDTQMDADDDDEVESDENDDYYSVGGVQGEHSDPCTPTTPKTRRLENYDPYQIFEVQHTPCLILTVRILQGRNITLGFQDYYDTPDPYINLVLRSSPEGKKTTTVKENDTNPVWNESFIFYINFTQANILEITLMESNALWFDQKVGTVYYDLVNIRDMDKPQTETFVFNKVSQVDIEFKLEFDRNPTLRYSLCLSPQEKEFMEQRKEKMMKGMRDLLGDEDGPQNIDEVPTIAVIGSGGGFRAMTGYSGVIKALFESGVLDCTMYAGGLSGSSWLLSTLYSHPKWPNIDMDEFWDELKHNIDKSLLRFLNASTMYAYIKFMIQKRKNGQPVSFTDIFGRMVGETLLSGRMETTLTDQREKIKGGAVPMPLYTCVHVKKDVPARSFQEWVEFSPYEIGLPKYGTFMDSELFGSKFFMGKLVKQYKEQPLHFLQGIWGSAFCILFKRLLEDNRRIDPVEMVRQEMGKQLDEAGQESSSDCSDDDINVEDSVESMDGDDEASQNTRNAQILFLKGKSESPNERGSPELDHNGSVLKEENDDVDGDSNSEADEKKGQQTLSFNNQTNNNRTKENEEDDSAYEGEAEDCEDDNSIDEVEDMKIKSKKIKPRGSVEMKRALRNKQSSKDSAFPEFDLTQESIEVPYFPAPAANETKLNSEVSQSELDQQSEQKKTVNWGVCPTLGKKDENGATTKRRQAFVSRVSMRKSRSGSKSYWNQVLKKIFESKSWELLSTRRGRAAVIHNFMRGLSLQQSYPLSPFTPVEERVKAGDEFDGIFEMHPTSVKHIYMVDAGLTFNSPFPLVLRPQREVDIILSFDFSARDSDNAQPFKELLLAEKWAKLNRLPFPPIDTTVFEKEGMKELYIFRHPTDPHCPVVFHFVLVNKRFKYYKKPDIPRETKEEFEFAEFDIFDDPKAAYSTFNFTYQHKSFERLSQLMEFNTLLHIDDIKQGIKDAIKVKREGPPRLPIQSKDIKLLHMKSVQEMRKLRRFIYRMESRSSFYSGNSPSTPYFTPTPNCETNANPFFPRNQQDVLLSPTNDNTLSPSTDRLSESFSRNNRLKKHLHPNDIISESEEINYLKSAKKDNLSQSNLVQNSSSFESASDLTPDNSNHFHHLGQASVLHQRNSTLIQADDTCDGVSEEACHADCVLKTELESSSANNSRESNSLSIADQSNILSGSTVVAKTTNKWPQLSHLAQTANTVNYNGTDSIGANSSGYLSDMSIDIKRKDCSCIDGCGNGTPGTGTFSVDSITAGNLGSAGSDKFIPKGRKKKDSPPNPFFTKASFMRSSHSSYLSSSPSNSSASSHTGHDSGNYRPNISTEGSYLLGSQTSQSPITPNSAGSANVVKRLNSKSIQLSPLVVSSNKKPTSMAAAQPLPPPTTPEIFTLAPEAFKLDGTPVFDSHAAKMYYESAKSKRKFFRRQSTVSSLKSISLEESEPSHCEVIGKNHKKYNSDIQSTPSKKKMTHFSDIYDESKERLSEVQETVGTTNTPQTSLARPSHGVDFDLHRFSQASDADNIEMLQVDQAASPSTEEIPDSTRDYQKDVWFDATDNAV